MCMFIAEICIEGVVSQNFDLGLTVNVEIFAQYIFSRISRRPLDARKFDVRENY